MSLNYPPFSGILGTVGGGAGAVGVMAKVFSLTSAQVGVGANTSGGALFTAGIVSLPANTLLAGSTVTFRLAGVVNNATGAVVPWTAALTVTATTVAGNTPVCAAGHYKVRITTTKGVVFSAQNIIAT